MTQPVFTVVIHDIGLLISVLTLLISFTYTRILSFNLIPICCETGSAHPELLFKLERWHCLLRLGAPLLPRCVRVLSPQPLQAQGKLPAGFQHRRVSSYSLYEEPRSISCGTSSGTAWFAHEKRTSLLSRFCVIVSLSAGGWQAAPLCWTLMTWWGWMSQTGSVCTRTSKSSTAAWWRKAWSKLKSGYRRFCFCTSTCTSMSCGQKHAPFSFQLFPFLCVSLALRSRGCFQCVWSMHPENVNVQGKALGCVLAVTYGCSHALGGQLALRISTFHWDYTSALIPGRASENQATNVVWLLLICVIIKDTFIQNCDVF